MAIHFACGKNPLEGEMFDENTITLITYLGYSVMIVILFLLWELFQKKTVSELGLTKNFCSYFIGIASGTGSYCVKKNCWQDKCQKEQDDYRENYPYCN